jgi:hypothetical protein
VIGYSRLVIGAKMKKSLLQGERRRPAGCVTHLAGHLFYPGRATRPRGGDSMKNDSPPRHQGREEEEILGRKSF